MKDKGKVLVCEHYYLTIPNNDSLRNNDDNCYKTIDEFC